jgi:hypothetical protein
MIAVDHQVSNFSAIKWIQHVTFIRDDVERTKIHTPYTQMHDRSLSWLDRGTSIKTGNGLRVYLKYNPDILILTL